MPVAIQRPSSAAGEQTEGERSELPQIARRLQRQLARPVEHPNFLR